MVIEEELLLSADFLAFFAPLLKPLRQDPTLLAVSAWNPYGPALSPLPKAVESHWMGGVKGLWACRACRTRCTA